MKFFGRFISPKWISAGRPKWIAIGSGIAVVLIVLGYLTLIPKKPDIPPTEAIIRTMENTSRESAYRYRIRMHTLIDGKKELVSDVRGEREKPDRIHIKGRIFESDIDFYLIESVTYSKDPINGEWVKITDNRINQQDIFMQELNPVAGFSYKQLNDAAFAGTQKVNGKKLWVFTVKPVVDNPYMEMLWKDFRYKFWVKPGSFLLYNAELSAVSKNDPANKLTLTVEFCDYGGDIEVNPPDTARAE